MDHGTSINSPLFCTQLTKHQNKTLSDDTDPVLALQGIGWWTRKLISLATVTLHVKQYTTDGITHIDIDQTATGGIKGTTELRELTWIYKEHDDHIFGHLNGKSRWLNPADIEDEWMKEGFLTGHEERGGPKKELFVESYVENDENGWTGDQIWGFAIIEDVRYYVRRVTIKKGDTTLKVRLVYNWYGPNP